MRKIVIIIFLLFISIITKTSAQTVSQSGGDCPYPIVFVHGINSNSGTWDGSTNQLEEYFGVAEDITFNLNASTQTLYVNDIVPVTNLSNLSNRCIYRLNFESFAGTSTESSSTESSIVKQGHALKMAIDAITQTTNKQKVIIVGHSMGGLAAREYLQRIASSNNHKVAKLITLGTPHLGADIAQFSLRGGVFGTVNPKSEASRDLAESVRITNDIIKGPYLFGGNENIAYKTLTGNNPFLNNDFNCDGNSDDAIIGLNEQTWDNSIIPLPNDIKYTYYVSNLVPIPGGDGVVDDMAQWLYKDGPSDGNGDFFDYLNGRSVPVPWDGVNHRRSDRINGTRSHFAIPLIEAETGETEDYKSIIRGVDEGDFPFYAFNITPSKTFLGLSQKRAYLVAPNSNILITGARGNDDPAIDGDWYKFTVASTVSSSILSISKPIEKYMKVDFFTTAPSNYDNPTDGNISQISLPSDEEKIMLINTGSLQANQIYYFRITTSAGRSSDNYFPYYFHLDQIANTNIVNFSPKHKPMLNSPLKAGLMRFIQDGDPEYIPSEDAWRINVKAYNGYFARFNAFKTSHPNCGISGEPFAIINEREADLASVFKTINAYTGSYKYFDSYSQKISFKAKFNENTGIYLSFPDNSDDEVIQAVLFPFLEPLLSNLVETLFSGSEALGVKKKDFIKKIGTTTYKNLLKIKTLPAFQAISTSFTRRNAVKFSEFMASQGADFISEQVLDAFKVNMESNPEFISLVPNWESFAVNKIADFVTFSLGSGSLFIDLSSAILESSLGGFDLKNNQGLKYCLPIDFEDVKPSISLTGPSNGFNTANGTLNLQWVGLDADNDALAYDVYVKIPGASDFTKVASDLSTPNFNYDIIGNGAYEWYVKAKYPFNPLIYTISNIGYFTRNCSANSFTVNTANYQLGINNDENLFDLALTFNGAFTLSSNYRIDYIIDDKITNLNSFQVTAQSLTAIINGLDKSKEITFIIGDGCKSHMEIFKPYPKIAYTVQSDFCLVHYKLEALGNNPHTVKINGTPVNLANVNDKYTQYVEKAGIFNIDIEYSLTNSAVKYRILQSETCPVENYVCPDLDIQYTFLEDEKIAISLNAPANDQLYFWKSNSGESYLLNTTGSNRNRNERNPSQEILPFYGLGSPKSILSIETSSTPVSCQNQDIIDEFLDLAFSFLTPEMRDALGLTKKAKECNWSPPIAMPNSNLRTARLPSSNDLPGKLKESIDDLFFYDLYKRSKLSKNLEIFGSLTTRDNFTELYSLVVNSINSFSRISKNDSLKILNEMKEFDFKEDELNYFINKWNKSITCWSYGFETNNAICPDIILKSNILFHDSMIVLSTQHAAAMNLSIDSLKNYSINSINNYSLEKDPTINPVCASVGISLSQKLTMTREAFEGTLKIFNGSTTGQMDSIKLDLVIKDEAGVTSNHLFEIETSSLTALTGISGTGQLAANKEGVAKILFIPESEAAPTTPRNYSFGGSISYKDPFSNSIVTMPLVPVTLQVNPSPDMYLHYFVERDIIGDDAFTSEVEPSVPARLAVMIENDGYGQAQNVKIQSAQPQVIDNEKGLALQMRLIGTKLQGSATNWGLSNIDFGNIPPLSTRVGEWLFTSNLLGHFTSYSTNVRHLSSRGNPDLSLISGAQAHELIHSVKIYGSQDDGILDFLTNEVQDANDLPDALYSSKGNTVFNVKQASSGQFLNPILYPTYTTTLQVTPQDSGWYYLKVNDPGQGEFRIVSVIRNSDNQVIPLDNAWLSYVTIPDTRIQNYEDKFHLVDHVPNNSTRTYTVVWSPLDPSPPYVDTIVNAPNTIVALPQVSLDVVFSEPIVDSTFTIADLSLTRQGGSNLINNTVSIVKVDSVTYTVNFSGLTTLSGYYVFTAQAAGIKDKAGVPGLVGKSVNWTQNLIGPVVTSVEGVENGFIYKNLDSILVTFNMPIDTAFLSPASFRLLKNGLLIDDTLEFSVIDNSFKKFKFYNLNQIFVEDNKYTFLINLDSIKSTTGLIGSDSQVVNFVIDKTGPVVVSNELLTESGLDQQHKTGSKIKFDQSISSLPLSSFTLLYNNVVINDSFISIQKLNFREYKLLWGVKSFDEGNYTFIIDATMIQDSIGNFGSGKDTLNWAVDRTTNLSISSISISPDLGFSSSDFVSSNRNVSLAYTLSEPAYNLKISLLDNGNTYNLITKSSTVNGSISDLITFPIVGTISIKIEANDVFGNLVDTIVDVYIDELDLSGKWIGTQDEIVYEHPSTIVFDFNEVVANSGLLPSSVFSIFRNNVLMSAGATSIVSLDDTLYRVQGLNNLPLIPGKYRVELQLSPFVKYLSGRPGVGSTSFSWEIFDPNLAPVANAGPDQVIKDLGVVNLDGFATFDPDGNTIKYKWISLDNIPISNDSIVNPTIVTNESHINKILTFLLIASDTSKSSSDLVRIFVGLDDILVKTKVMLQGPYVASTGLMKDSLRSKSMLPLSNPYTNTNYYKYGNDGKTITNTHLFTTGPNAIVDWVYVELFYVNVDSAVRGGSFLLQRDGDIVDPFSSKTPIFENLENGKYSLRIYHRNHLPIMTSDIVIINPNEIEQVDLTQDLSQIEGGVNAIKSIAGVYTMIAGDVNRNGQIQQTDVILALPKIGQAGYFIEDIDMNGEVQNLDIQNYIFPNLGRGKQFK
jgi:pimeloyl-ACP methyl ester carboxylesterase